MNFNLYLIINEYYQNDHISIYSNEYYHDYNLSIYLQLQKINVVIQKIQQVKIEYSSLPLNLIDVFYDFILIVQHQVAGGLVLEGMADLVGDGRTADKAAAPGTHAVRNALPRTDGIGGYDQGR